MSDLDTGSDNAFEEVKRNGLQFTQDLISRTPIVAYGYVSDVIDKDRVIVVLAVSVDGNATFIEAQYLSYSGQSIAVACAPQVNDSVVVLFPQLYDDDMFVPRDMSMGTTEYENVVNPSAKSYTLQGAMAIPLAPRRGSTGVSINTQSMDDEVIFNVRNTLRTFVEETNYKYTITKDVQEEDHYAPITKYYSASAPITNTYSAPVTLSFGLPKPTASAAVSLSFGHTASAAITSSAPVTLSFGAPVNSTFTASAPVTTTFGAPVSETTLEGATITAEWAEGKTISIAAGTTTITLAKDGAVTINTSGALSIKADGSIALNGKTGSVEIT
jgi:hypothetical protein